MLDFNNVDVNNVAIILSKLLEFDYEIEFGDNRFKLVNDSDMGKKTIICYISKQNENIIEVSKQEIDDDYRDCGSNNYSLYLPEFGDEYDLADEIAGSYCYGW